MAVLTPDPLRLSVLIREVRTDLVRKRIMAMVKARLQRIRVSNGFFTEMGLRVSRGMLIEPEPTTLPRVNFWDSDESATQRYGLDENVMTLQVETYDKVATAPTVTEDDLSAIGEKLLADVKAAIFINHITLKKDPTFDGLVEKFAYTDSQLIIGLQPELWVLSVSRWMMEYHTRPGDPYQQMQED